MILDVPVLSARAYHTKERSDLSTPVEKATACLTTLETNRRATNCCKPSEI